jgi:integrase/recombinase XerD
MQAVYEAFKNYVHQIGYRKPTQRMLSACVKDFLAYNNIIEVKQITTRHIELFYNYLLQREQKNKTQQPLSETYINHHVYALKVFFNWLVITQQIKQNPMSNLAFKKPTIKTREPLTQLEIKALFAACSSLVETTILHLAYSCGLRRNEVENLYSSDIDTSKCLVYVRAGKGAKRRVVPITATVAKAFNNYNEYKLRTIITTTNQNINQENHNQEPFLKNCNGKRLTGQQANYLLKKLVTKAGLPGNISLHHLRHSIATHLLQNGLSVEKVKEFLGHSSLTSTQLYTKIINYPLKIGR